MLLNRLVTARISDMKRSTPNSSVSPAAGRIPSVGNVAEQPEFAKGLTTPVRLTVGSRNWGDTRFTPVASASGD